MMLWLMNPQLERLQLLENFSSYIVTKHYFKPSSFELHLPLTEEMLRLIRENQLCTGNLMMQSDTEEAYLIEELQPNFEHFGGEIIIKGRDLRAYLERRIIMKEEVQTATPDILIRSWLTECILSPADSKRRIAQFEMGNLPVFKDKLTIALNYQNLLEAMSDLCKITGFGFKVRVNLAMRKLFLDVYQGVDRTGNQTKHTQAIFSQEFENILTQAFTENLMDQKTTAILSYEHDEIKKLLEVSNNEQGLSRKEIYIDATSSGKGDENHPISESEQKELVKQEGLETLANYQMIQTMEADVITNGNLRYQEDYDLGDKVTVISEKLGLRLDTRIETIEEVYEQNGREIRLIFGNKVPTLVDKIKRKVK
ncbi:siphovirus ReqiPepy6 Gp37-like family protein [Isobaculum melis]|uniref:Virus ReqiPepy6 Gp37-like protein n=1 Tax=Isobaculum melis TaxID=142588 RepID=A0A1H9TH18_9LACT|nr:siphovirus ReqiPepy6 Gp37-like family protein [Isobaculum melis]SER96418.1 virus ReqiPepy6 Gp37-like protein [Isobaculum melis]